MQRKQTLRDKVETRISRKRDDVFLPREFGDLGGEDQVLRVLRGLVRDGRLVRLGYGVYGRAVVSRLSGKPILYSPNGFLGAARQALTKLGVKWEPTEAQRAYNEGRSTQIPVNPAVRIKGRFSRRLRYGNTELRLDRYSQQRKGTAAEICALAARYKVSYNQTETDVWANQVTRLAGDDVALDEIELLLIALQRTGHLSRPEALKLQVNYLREARL